MVQRGNVRAGKELMGFYIDQAVAKRVRVTAAERGESNSALAERALRRELGMAETYRAAIYRAETGDETVLTGPQHAHLTDEELVEQAIREARSADLIGDEEPRVSEEQMRLGIYIGEWVE